MAKLACGNNVAFYRNRMPMKESPSSQGKYNPNNSQICRRVLLGFVMCYSSCLFHLTRCWQEHCCFAHSLRTRICGLICVLILLSANHLGLLQIFFQQRLVHFAYPLEVDMPLLVKSLRNGNPPPRGIQPINAAKFPFRYENSARCSKRRSYDLLVLVKSSLSNRHFRDVLRRTWAAALTNDLPGFYAQYAFLLGYDSANTIQQKELDVEQSRFGDIVQQEFLDNYYNNTFKTMLGFSWAAQRCRNARYVLFADDDYYVNPWNLKEYLRSIPSHQYRNLLAGYIWDMSMPKRLTLSKWYISVHEYPYMFWPPYPTGGAYLASMEMVQDLAIAQCFTRFLRFDDVFVGILLKKLGIQPLHHDLFSYYTIESFEPQLYSKAIACHTDRNPNEILRIWRSLNLRTHSLVQSRHQMF